jgi:precorrin-6B methylase 1
VKGVSTANIGPDLTTIGTVGGTRKPGMAAEAYIRESLQSPSTFIVPGQAPIMPPDIAKTLSQADLDDMVAYLLSLK